MNTSSVWSKSFLSKISPEDLNVLIQSSSIVQYEPEEEIIKPESKAYLYLVAEGEVALCDLRNPKIEILLIGKSKTLELGKYLSQAKDWQFYWKSKNISKIVKIPWSVVIEVLKKYPQYLDYLSKISNSPELQKFNRSLRLLNYNSATRIELISSLNRKDFAHIFSNYESKKFIILCSGKLRINTYLEGGKYPLVDLQAGDDALIDLNMESNSLEMIENGEAWYFETHQLSRLKNVKSIGDLLSLYVSKKLSTEKHSSSHSQEDNTTNTNNIQNSWSMQKVVTPIHSKFAFLVLAVTSSIVISLQFISSLTNRITFDQVLVHKSATEAALVVSITLFFNLISELIQKNIQNITQYLSKATLAKNISTIFDKLIQSKSNYINNIKQSELIDGFEHYSEEVELNIRLKVESALWVVSFISIAVFFRYLVPQLVWVIPVSIFCIIAFSMISLKLTHHISKTKELSQNNHFQNTYELHNQFQNYKANNLWPVLKSHWSQTQNDLNFFSFLEGVADSIETHFLEFFLDIIKLTILFSAVVLFFNNQISFGLTISLPLILSAFLSLLRRFHSHVQTYFKLKSHENLSAVLKSIDEQQPVYEAVQNSENIIEVKNLSFQYYKNNSRFKIENINFNIKDGEKILLIGPSGSGKSTLIFLLTGLIDSANSIFKMFSSNQQVFVSQKGNLFPGTLIQNITGFQEDINFEEVQNICDKLDLTSVIERLPASFQTVINPQLKYFSEGQRQKIQIARLFFSNYKACFLDESTSLLDAVSEHRVLNYIFGNLKDKTIVFATQRVHIVPYFDRIFFMKNGQIVEAGTHQELINLKGHYFEYFCSQIRH